MVYKAETAIFKNLYFRILVYLIVFLVLAMPIGTALEQHFLYFPTKKHDALPSAIGLPYEDISFRSADDVQLSGWLIHGQDNAPVVLFCIGNAGNISHRLDTLKLLHEVGVNVFIFDYRGYGTSEGKASEPGLYQDASAAYELLRERGWAEKQIVIFGRSLGAAVGLEIATIKSPAGLIMESAFTSVPSMGRYHYPLLNTLFGWLVDAEYDNLGKISFLDCPLLLIHGDRDRICPPRMAEELYEKAPSPKKMYWIQGADHNDSFIVGRDRYMEELQQAIRTWTGFSS